MATFFNEFFGVSANTVDDYGAFNVSLINDLPLFIDPFLLFNSEKAEYKKLHNDILRYIIFLRDETIAGNINKDLERAWFYFPEVRQNWLGFSLVGNGGTGLGKEFASALRGNLQTLFADFGKEQITRGTHLEKVCLVRKGVGRDNISDFTANLVKDFLCSYTEKFAQEHIASENLRDVWINKSYFSYEHKAWLRKRYRLPYFDGDYVLLTPKDILTRDENWINRGDMIHGFEDIAAAIPDEELRGQVFRYFADVLARPKNRLPNQRERDEAAVKTLIKFPELVDYYIKLKENNGDKARDLSSEKVSEIEDLFNTQVRSFQHLLAAESGFYKLSGSTYEETHERIAYLKDVIENKGGHRIFYHKGQAIQREQDLQILYRFVWFGSPSDVGTEANDGRGPVDYKISRGAKDKTLVEMKLAKNTGLERNLERQLPIYQAASDAQCGIKAIIYFSAEEKARVDTILKKLKIEGHKDIVLIDARIDNKPSGSKA